MPTESLPTPVGDGAETPRSYIDALLRKAAPDVSRRLAASAANLNDAGSAGFGETGR